MQEHGFLPDEAKVTAARLLEQRESRNGRGSLVSVAADTTLEDAIHVMQEHEISQLPITRDGEVVGSLVEQHILESLIGDPDARARLVADLMGDPFPIVEETAAVSELAGKLGRGAQAVLVRGSDGQLAILTRSDLIGALGG
ncbi:MAG: CBS domain-containing protein [Gemmatimonadota bacterium]